MYDFLEVQIRGPLLFRSRDPKNPPLSTPEGRFSGGEAALTITTRLILTLEKM